MRRLRMVGAVLAALTVTAPAAYAQSAELPLGRPGLAETRETIVLGPGVTYTRINRAGTTPPPLDAFVAQFPAESGAVAGVGPWAVHILEIAPDAPYELDLVAGDDATAGRELVSDMAVRTGAIVGVNGGYFVTNEDDGITGEPAGLGVYGGRLTSEAVQGRANLVLDGAAPRNVRVQELFTDLALVDVASGDEILVDGVNRKHGLIRMCGGVGGDTAGPEPATGLGLPAPGGVLPGQGAAPAHDWTCVDDTEVIVHNEFLGIPVPADADLEVRLDGSGRVQRVGAPTGAVVAPGELVVTATGDGPTQWLSEHAAVGAQLAYREHVLLPDGSPLEVTPELEVTNGGPRLVRDGEVAIDSEAEGFSALHPLPGFGTFYSETAQPRLLAGSRADGTLLFVLVDGRRPDWSTGVSFREAADLMIHLGAIEAINLDGGGSAAMVDGTGTPMNRVSGGSERAVMDGLVLVPIEPAADAAGTPDSTVSSVESPPEVSPALPATGGGTAGVWLGLLGVAAATGRARRPAGV